MLSLCNSKNHTVCNTASTIVYIPSLCLWRFFFFVAVAVICSVSNYKWPNIGNVRGLRCNFIIQWNKFNWFKFCIFQLTWNRSMFISLKAILMIKKPCVSAYRSSSMGYACGRIMFFVHININKYLTKLMEFLPWKRFQCAMSTVWSGIHVNVHL